MKKLLFTLIGFVGITGVAMAKSPKKQIEIKTEISSVEYDKCMDKAIAVVEAYGSSDPIANYELYQWVLAHC